MADRQWRCRQTPSGLPGLERVSLIGRDGCGAVSHLWSSADHQSVILSLSAYTALFSEHRRKNMSFESVPPCVCVCVCALLYLHSTNASPPPNSSSRTGHTTAAVVPLPSVSQGAVGQGKDNRWRQEHIWMAAIQRTRQKVHCKQACEVTNWVEQQQEEVSWNTQTVFGSSRLLAEIYIYSIYIKY